MLREAWTWTYIPSDDTSATRHPTPFPPPDVTSFSSFSRQMLLLLLHRYQWQNRCWMNLLHLLHRDDDDFRQQWRKRCEMIILLRLSWIEGAAQLLCEMSSFASSSYFINRVGGAVLSSWSASFYADLLRHQHSSFFCDEVGFCARYQSMSFSHAKPWELVSVLLR